MTRNSLDTYWLSKYVFGLHWYRIAIILSAALGKQNHDLVCGSFATVSFHSDISYAAQKFHQSEVLEQILMHKDDAKPPAFYVGTASVDLYLPGFRQENDLDLGHLKPLISIWMGNQSRIAAHWDGMTNIACCVAGHRRFTLFPPDQIANLYPGPFDFTPAGQVVSMVDFADPDFDRFPKFEAAIAAGQVADLEPGDALLLPSMWWHHVEGLSCFNALVNYWWRAAPPYTGPGIAVLEHALLALRDLPMPEKRAWKNLFDHYVFSPKAQASDHIPETARGVLALDDMKARRLRAKLINKLNR